MSEPYDLSSNETFEEVAAMFEQVFEGTSTECLPATELEPLREHITRLTEGHKIEWDEKSMGFLDARGSFEDGPSWIATPLVDSELAYLVALHEIGHIVLRLDSFEDATDSGQPVRLYANEAAVWEWALDNSMIAPSTDAAEKIAVFLLTDDPGEGRQEALQRVRARISDVRARLTST